MEILSMCPTIHACCEHDNSPTSIFDVWLHLGLRKVPFEIRVAMSKSKMAAAIYVEYVCEPCKFVNFKYKQLADLF